MTSRRSSKKPHRQSVPFDFPKAVREVAEGPHNSSARSNDAELVNPTMSRNTLSTALPAQLNPPKSRTVLISSEEEEPEGMMTRAAFKKRGLELQKSQIQKDVGKPQTTNCEYGDCTVRSSPAFIASDASTATIPHYAGSYLKRKKDTSSSQANIIQVRSAIARCSDIKELKQYPGLQNMRCVRFASPDHEILDVVSTSSSLAVSTDRPSPPPQLHSPESASQPFTTHLPSISTPVSGLPPSYPLTVTKGQRVWIVMMTSEVDRLFTASWTRGVFFSRNEAAAKIDEILASLRDIGFEDETMICLGTSEMEMNDTHDRLFRLRRLSYSGQGNQSHEVKRVWWEIKGWGDWE